MARVAKSISVERATPPEGMSLGKALKIALDKQGERVNTEWALKLKERFGGNALKAAKAICKIMEGMGKEDTEAFQKSLDTKTSEVNTAVLNIAKWYDPVGGREWEIEGMGRVKLDRVGDTYGVALVSPHEVQKVVLE